MGTIKELIKDERGVYLFVEAAIVYPIMLVLVMIIIFISMIFTLKANMQSALETALMYCKTEMTDRYVGFIDNVSGNTVSRTGYTELKRPTQYSNIYSESRNEFGSGAGEEKFREMFFNNYKFLNFSAGEGGGNFYDGGINVEIDTSANFIIYRELNAKAEQKIRLPFVKGMFGLDNTVTIEAEAKITVSDSVSVMRITDVADYVLAKTGAGDTLDSIFGDNINKFLNFIDADSGKKDGG